MSVPVMSDGIRSGVNWMRENFSSSTRASVWIEQRLRQARHADDQAVAADEQRQQHLMHGVCLADDQLLQLRDDLVAALLHPVGQRDIIGRLDIDDLLRHTIHLGLAFSVSYQLPATGFQLSSLKPLQLPAGSWQLAADQCVNP